MNSEENTFNKEEKSQKKHRRATTARLANIPTIPPATLKNIMTVSISIQHYAEQNRRVIEQLAKTSAIYQSVNLGLTEDVLKIIQTQNRLIDFNKALSFPAVELATTVQSIERLLASDVTRIGELFKQTSVQTGIWKEQQEALGKIAKSLQQSDMVWRSHFVEISKVALLAQTSLSRIPWGQIGNALDVQDSIRNSLQGKFLEFSESYKNLFASFEIQPSIIVSLPPTISRLPTVEFFNGTTVIDAITIGEENDSELEDEIQQATEESKRETEDRLEALLAQLNAEFITPLQGARQSLASANPDRVRHFATSLRELFTHVLHTLAPDDKVKEWSNVPGYFDRNKPTRRARLLYICRILNHDPFSAFIEKDIDADLAFLQLFQQGTHEVTTKYTDFQLKIMLLRMESTLRFLLEIWHLG